MAFKGCTSLSSINVPEGVTNIEEMAFKGCTSLTGITIPGVKTIRTEAFSGCTSLASVTVLYGVQHIHSEAFRGCSALTSIALPASVISIGDMAFADCTSLRNITLPESVSIIGIKAFDNTAYFNTEANWENEVLYIGSVLVSAKETISGTYSVKSGTTRIGYNVFSGCSRLTGVVIPDGIVTIGQYAFLDCTSLSSITLPEEVEEIGQGAFENTAYCNDESNWEGKVLYIGQALICADTSLSGIYTVKDGTTCIGEHAFVACTGLTGVILPESLVYLGAYAFSCCSNLTDVTLSAGITRIGHFAFNRCSTLTNITIPDSVTSIGISAFNECSKLTRISIPDGVQSIERSTFSACYELSNVTIGKGVTLIDEEAFYYCQKLISIIIPGTVKSIGDRAFFECELLTAVTILDGVTSIGKSAFYHCENLVSLKIADSVIHIESGAFNWCSKLKNVTIPSNVKSIEPFTFKDCGIIDITIPDRVTSIGYSAFDSCFHLTGVTIPATVTSIEESAFSRCSELAEVHYGGTAMQWTQIDIGPDNDALLNAPVYATGTGGGNGRTESTFRLENDTWQFGNSYKDFGTTGWGGQAHKNDGYFIYDEDWMRFILQLSRSEIDQVVWDAEDGSKVRRPNINGKYPKSEIEPWGGSCFGMSTLVCLAYEDTIRPSDISGSAQFIQDIGFSKAVESAINYYQLQQFMSGRKQLIMETATISAGKQLAWLETAAKAIENGGPLIRIDFAWYDAFNPDNTPDKDSYHGHSVVGYALTEEGGPWFFPDEYLIDAVFTKKIEIYDPAHPGGDDQYDLYFNGTSWYIPGLGVRSTTNDITSLYDNGTFCSLATNDSGIEFGYENILNLNDYKTGEINTWQRRWMDEELGEVTVGLYTTITTPADSSYIIHAGGGTYAVNGLITETLEGTNEVYAAPECCGPDKGGSVMVLLPFEAESITIETNEPMDFQIKSAHAFQAVQADSSGTVTCSGESISFSSDQECEYALHLTLDDGYTPMDYYTLDVAGTTPASAGLAVAEEGLILSSDSFEDTTVKGTNGSTPQMLAMDTTEDQVFITTDSDNGLIALSDPGGDGSFDTECSTQLALPSAQVLSASLTLGGDIGVNYYVSPNAALAADPGAYAKFICKGQESEPILLGDLELDGNGRYTLTRTVNAKEMTERIVLRLYTSDGAEVTLTSANGTALAENAAVYSVARYVSSVTSEKGRALVAKLAAFGARAMDYFGYEPVMQDEAYAGTITAGEVGQTAAELEAYRPAAEGAADGIAIRSFSLTLESLTTLNLAYTLESGRDIADYTFTVDGKPVEPEADGTGSVLYVRIPDISARSLDTAHTIAVTDGEGTLTLTCSALSFAYNTLHMYEGNDGKAALCDLVRALYEYNAAAKSYFGA